MVFFKLGFPCVATDVVNAMMKGVESGELHSRFVQRISPVSRTGHATLEGLDETARKVLPEYFCGDQLGIKVL